jgi:hypothetical protein
MPNGSEREIQSCGCPDCVFELIPTPRGSLFVAWICGGGCGMYPPDMGGGPIGGAS